MTEDNKKSKGCLPPGTLLQGGKYRIIRYINQGGFGCTYEAEHTVFGDRVAIKELFVKEYCNRNDETGMISVGVLSKQGLVERLGQKFIEEAKALRSLRHPNIVRVTDVFEENSTAYYVMDYINGYSLESIMETFQGPMPERDAVRFIRMVAEALAYVHANLRLHLDIKPGNIMIDENDKAIIIDFGASKQYDEQGRNESTVTGFTRNYAPIEQIGGHLKVFSPATDIFALGSTLYRLLTGEVPVDCLGRSTGIQLRPLPDSVSQSTRLAVERAMSIAAVDRPQSISQFLDILLTPSAPEPEPDTVYVGPDGGHDLDSDGGAGYDPEPPMGGSGGGNDSGGNGSDSGGGKGPKHPSPEPSKKSPWPWVIGIILFIVLGIGSFLIVSNYIHKKSIPEGYVDLGLSKYWAKTNLRESDTCALLTRDEVKELLPVEMVDSVHNRYSLPTADDWQELIENCEWEYTPSPGGYRVTGPSGEWIFIAADGMELEENGSHKKQGGGVYARYWVANSNDVFTFEGDKKEFIKAIAGQRYSARPVVYKTSSPITIKDLFPFPISATPDSLSQTAADTIAQQDQVKVDSTLVNQAPPTKKSNKSSYRKSKKKPKSKTNSYPPSNASAVTSNRSPKSVDF